MVTIDWPKKKKSTAISVCIWRVSAILHHLSYLLFCSLMLYFCNPSSSRILICSITLVLKSSLLNSLRCSKCDSALCVILLLRVLFYFALLCFCWSPRLLERRREERRKGWGREERNERRAQGFIFLFPPMLLFSFFLAQTPQNSLYILGWPQ